MKFYTYLYLDPSRNNEPIYVGKGSNLRAWKHLKNKGNTPFINRLKYMRNLGVEPNIVFLGKNISEKEAFSLEIWFIYKFGRKDLDKGSLLNLTDGGDGPAGQTAWNKGKTGVQNYDNPERSKKISEAARGRKCSELTRLKMSEKRKGKTFSEEHKAKMSDSAKGRILSKEHRASISNTKLGKPLSQEHRNKISNAALGKKRGPYKKKAPIVNLID